LMHLERTGASTARSPSPTFRCASAPRSRPCSRTSPASSPTTSGTAARNSAGARERITVVETELRYLRDAYERDFDATVVEARADQVALDRTAFYPTGGGQPHDTATLGPSRVAALRKQGYLARPRLAGP